MDQFLFQAIGTEWKIDIYRKLSKTEHAALFSFIQNRIELFDKAYSRFRADSLVTKMSQQAGQYELSDDAEPMMSLYYDLYKKTEGLVTPLVGNILSDAGYDSEYSLRQKKPLQPAPRWEDAIVYERSHLTVKMPIMLDFGAAGKGYLVDLIGKVLEQNGIKEYCINAGGDILHKGIRPVRVGLEHPENFDQVIGVYTLQNKSICGSAGNRRKWADFTHIINPKTLASPKHLRAVWVVAETALLADALATCLFFVSPRVLLSSYSFGYFLLHEDYSFEKSDQFIAELFVN